ncbi:TonB-dependent receptor [Aquimarina intermedia]|uniref:Outer membrane receptor for Fe3+-dicitrate n=1 Tax=Aquimarina intermedia TaxID=350814 RepID=A0A5S5C0I4_9FLAO|nr:TonB-dependent receptor [Aquimarina intermedia]TYP72804.1 outer membrane receptor for Fe3+-dicitrate [Aquimarina intermedia]
MTTKYTALILLLLSNLLNAQQEYTGIVTDEFTNPISGATVIDLLHPKNGVVTNNDGFFKILLYDSTKVSIQFIGYHAKELELSTSLNQISLQQENILLSEVLITSASRELQRRSDIPRAIGILSAKDIKESKAFGIDQLVNQISGVYMSTSQAASNEQHFMAVRSPISTKALFLYLEDGMPIRPTSVFNHNALLEMNDLSFDRIEVLKGPASSIYGSEAIGGSFNFVTKKPTDTLSGSLGFQTNDLGLTRYDVEVSNETSETFGFYLGSQYTFRNDGPVAHSDYEKFATTFKTVIDFSPSLKWTTVTDLIQYRSDMSGSLNEKDYREGNYQSDQTFTQRDALAFRSRNTLDMIWNNKAKTTANFVFRSNQMDQNPSYRIRQFRNQGQLTGIGSGEINSNQYNSYVGLIQHRQRFNYMKSSLITGASIDYSPQKYSAETTAVLLDPATGKNLGFTLNAGDYILNYEANILNYAGYIQYEISPIRALKLTAALRYDRFEYDYNNLAATQETYENQERFDNWTPKLGINYTITNQSGVYTNYSQGFTPPQVSTLYRSKNELTGIKPSIYHNYEIGGYFNSGSRWKLDVALYVLDGKNTLITLRNADDTFLSTNAGATRSYGIEYGITYTPIKNISLTHNGSYAKHRYVDFFDRGIDYSNTDRETAPNLLGNSSVTYRTSFSNKLGVSLTASHELVGKYATCYENQIIVTKEAGDSMTDANGNPVTDTATYSGHNIFNLRATVNIYNLEVWGHVLNIFDSLYAARASYSPYTNQNNYTIGTPRAFHFGVRYNF